MLELKERLIVALDVDSLDKAKYFVDLLYPKVNKFKIGSVLFTASGPSVVEMIDQKGAKVFLDLKFHDIPHTVFSAVASGTGLSCEPAFISTTSLNIEKSIRENIRPAVFMMTVHTIGGKEMLKEAVRGATEKAAGLRIIKPCIVGITRLTSDENTENTQKDVLAAARLAKDSGLDGVVCSVHEAAMVRKEFGEKFLIVTPGIRPKGYKKDDQSRTATAQEAIQAGANYIVVGRPILEAKKPLLALEELLAEIKQGC